MKYFNPATETDPEGLTEAGVRRMKEILAHMRTDNVRCAMFFESECWELAHIYVTRPEIISLRIKELMDKFNDEEAWCQLREESE